MLTHNERVELERQAQAKLAEARKLVKEAGALAKEGKFILEFNVGGTFIPKGYKDPALYREEAIEILKTEGRNDGWDPAAKCTKYTPYDQIPADEMEGAIEDTIESIIENLEIPYEYREYGGGDGTDSWWSPSTC